MHLSGLALNCKPDKATFTLDVDVYVSSYKDARDGTGSNLLRPTAPFLCKIPDSPKYKSGGKPMPYNRRYVSIVGALTDVTFINGDRHQGIERFHIIVDQIVFLGQPSGSAGTGVMANTLDSESVEPFPPRLPLTISLNVGHRDGLS
jgi:hypothetical protein